ncbi:hypothetical protein MBRU_05355 [Mycolicibacterium brumae DSM 44177]|nr:hypothetical protein MBRU_05355 [Mycolicibacterium brumae DSM 44177]
MRAAWPIALAMLLAVTGCVGVASTPAPDGPIMTPAAWSEPLALRQTAAGAVRGVSGAGYSVYQGIPYAAPPVGPLRWKHAIPAAPWTGLRDATAPSPRCVQEGGSDAEDCLTLNVWAPVGAPAKPVLVWFHGGGFASGSASLYQARRLAVDGDLVVVTVNYRLGALGFLAHPQLEDGNFGFTDQQLALRWVRDSIAAFGGDPNRVTIAGESAGAMAVCDHLSAPGSAGLFHAAILASGPCQNQVDLESARAVGREYARSVGCPDGSDVARCLRALPAAELRGSPWYVRYAHNRVTGPVYGTPELPAAAMSRLGEPGTARVPVMIGTTADEFTLFTAITYLRTHELPSAAEYPGLLRSVFGDDAAAVADRYPLHPGDEVIGRFAEAVTDGVFSCPTARMASLLSRRVPVYAYEFDDPDPPTPVSLQRVPFRVGAAHSLELRSLFEIGGAPDLTASQVRLSEQMIRYWSAFASYGAPAVPGAPDWPRWRTGEVLSLRPDGPRTMTTFATAHHCEFWNSLAR